MPVGIPGLGYLLGIVLTVVGLIVAMALRAIDFEDMGSVFSAAVGLMIAGWAATFLWGLLLPDDAGPALALGWRFLATMLGVDFVFNTIALGLVSLFVSGLKVRGFVGLLVAGAVVALVGQSMTFYQVVRIGLAHWIEAEASSELQGRHQEQAPAETAVGGALRHPMLLILLALVALI